MKTLFSTILAALIYGLVCICSAARGQSLPPGGKISGAVSDSASGKPLDFVTVNLMLGNAALKADFTKTDGSFAFEKLKPGKYSVVLVGVGYHSKTLTADLSDSLKNTIDLGLIVISPATVGLKEVTVTAFKPIVKQEIDRITYDLQADPESKVYSVLEMMRKVPFLSVDGDENIYLKGNADFKILINGKPSSMVERSYKEVLRSMPASSIERIEVITMPPAKYDAEGLAGIINIITNKKLDNGYNGTLNVSERFRVGGPGFGGTFSAKLGKFGMTALAGGSIYDTPLTRTQVGRTALGTEPSELFQENFTQSGNKNGYIGYEISYEADSLNLLSAQVNFNGSKSDGSGNQTSVINVNEEVVEGYRVRNFNDGRGKGMDAALNYQKGFKADKNRLLTLSYRYYGFDNDQNSNLLISERINYDTPDYRQINDQSFSEQTFQVDYVYPIKKLNIEAGLKGIMRDNQSDFQYSTYDAERKTFVVNTAMSNMFNNTQNVFGAYNTYQYSFKNWGVKAGARIEQTVINADFVSTDSKVKQNYFNVIPSVSINRKFKDNVGVNFGYTQRIQRPGIYQLNPFVDRTNPSFERTGNPDLRPAFVHDLQLGYSKSKKGSINFGVGFTQFKDLIFAVAVYNPETEITRTSYGNTGRARLINGNLNMNYPITKKWNFSANLRIAHGKVTGVVNGAIITNSGVMYQLSASTGYKLEKDWRINANLVSMGPSVNLQGTSNSMISPSFSVNKDIIKDKLSFSAAANNPFTKFRKYHTETSGPNFTSFNDRRDYFRYFNVSLNYKFGRLKEAIKKNKRSIRNDDVQN
ncbi:outer membrane beta-barrel protein [Dyadobacter chenhuakuii]|uniref:TonB-dependent receptor n=1 Tax=Dyadobacter chenhuakuii TaxID=2909339 RepID=A0ABY4XEH3_9BACT|nr:outer membrane beta-barrel protein [Dyadobacter chenhuakuii]MCF2492060.1 TonB-dependent receptor [Dyadobacter chenhuakuii]USJ28780.1 TonB-dependent receptor [Dyadobacter chenhuakuii]